MKRLNFAHTIAVAALFAVVSATPVLGQEEDGPRTTLDGVFTEQQVERGEKVFTDTCLECHDSIEFVESGYMASWSGTPVFELYDYLATMMPDDNPGSLRPRQYTAVLSYIFSLNGLPAGDAPLDDDPETLQNILIEVPEEGDDTPPRPMPRHLNPHPR